jgi:hypothetical protein
VRAEVLNDATSWTIGYWETLTDAPHILEIDWRAASAPGSNNGSYVFSIDGVPQTSSSNLDTDARRIDQARMGAVSGLDNGTRGTYYFDAFESWR